MNPKDTSSTLLPARSVRRALAIAVAAATAMLGPLPQLAHADGTVAAAQEVTIPPQTSAGAIGPYALAADATGYLVSSATPDGLSVSYTWHADDGSTVRDLGSVDTTPQATVLGDGSTLLWALSQDRTRVETFDWTAGAWTAYTLPTGLHALQVLPMTTGWTVAASDAAPGGTGAAQRLHLLDPAADGTFTDRSVTGWPQTGGAAIGAWQVVPGSAVVQYTTVDGARQAALVDSDTAAIVTSGPCDTAPVINHDFFGWGVDGAVELRPRSDPQAAARTLSLPQGSVAPNPVLTDAALLVNVLAGDPLAKTVYSVPLDGGPATVLLDRAVALRPAADGGALMDLADSSGTKATYRTPPAGGAATLLYRLPTYEPEHIGLSLVRGMLHRAETRPYGDDVETALYSADLGVSAAPAAAAPGFYDSASDASVPRCDGTLRCLPLADGGAGDTRVERSDAGDTVEGRTGAVLISGSHGGRIVSADGDRAVYDSGSDGRQYVLDLSSRTVVSTRPITAAALWGDTLWSAAATPGAVAVSDAATGAVRQTVTTGAPCVPDELQAVAHWLYWSCGVDGPAGVWDAATATSVRVPAGHALLGDGFVLRHAGDQLVLTDVHTGTAAADRVVAALPAGSYSDDRDVTWTLDRHGDFLAYTDPQGATHVLPSGVPHSAIGVLSSTVPSTAAASATGWQPSWTLTRPGAWRLELRRKGSTTLVWSTEGTTRGPVGVTWNGRTRNEEPTPDGPYTWTLTLTSADGQAGAATASGTVTLAGGPEAPRDYSGDDVGDLFGLTSGGRLDLRPGTGSAPGGVRAVSSSGGGWPATSLLVPYGDMNGDRVKDLLVRDAAGHLTRYDGTSGRAFAASGPHQVIGWGWNVYDALTPIGDITGDGRTDLLARDAHGDLWLYAATPAGAFAPRKKVGYGYQMYDLLVGTPDLTQYGDPGVTGQLLARDRSGGLWSYATEDHGWVGGPARIGWGWNIYNAIVPVGDVDGDGYDDIITRDSAGVLWFYAGRGDHRLAPRVRIGWGWQSYRSLL